MLISKLLYAKQSNMPISVYSDQSDTEVFTLGYIIDVSNEYVLLGSITPYGYYDGYTIKQTDSIYRVEINDEYGLGINKLYTLYKQRHSDFMLSENLVLSLLQFAFREHLVVGIELCNSGNNDLTGFVTNFQEPYVVVKQINDNGQDDGESIVNFNDITCITCDSEREIALKSLSIISMNAICDSNPEP